MQNKVEMIDYRSNLLNFLENSGKRNLLTEILLDKTNQKDLFGYFELKDILNNLTLQINKDKPLYQRWSQKKGDKERHLSIPNKNLKLFLGNYVSNLIKSKSPHKNCHGAEKGWSVKKSLESHLPFLNALSFDLENAFENFTMDMVENFFYSAMDNNFNYSEKKETANFLSILSTVNYCNKRGLPQGSSISMSLFNRGLYFLDERISKKAKEKKLTYSRWVDDFTITSDEAKDANYFLGAVELTLNHFPISKQKIFFQEDGKIYLLGYKILNQEIIKNSKEEKLENKCPPIKFEKWFSNNGIRKYEKWE